jgi:hypothetical protein
MIPPGVTYLTFPVQKTNTPIPRRGKNSNSQIPNFETWIRRFRRFSQIQIKKSSEFVGARCGSTELAEVCAPVRSPESNKIMLCF